MIDDLGADIVVWQEAEVGEAVRAARAKAGVGDARWLQHDADGDGAYEAFLQGGRPTIPSRAIAGSDPVLMLYTAASRGTPNGALLSPHAVLVQGLMMANLQRIDPTYVYLNSGPLFHVATFMTTLATFLLRRHERVHTAGSTPTSSAGSSRPSAAPARSSWRRPSTRSSRSTRDGRYDLSSAADVRAASRSGTRWSPSTTRRGPSPGGFGQTEVMGMLTFNASGRRDRRPGRPSPLVAGAHRRPRRQRGARPARPARSARADRR